MDKLLTLFRIEIFVAAHGLEGSKNPPSLKNVTHILQQQNLAQFYLA